MPKVINHQNATQNNKSPLKLLNKTPLKPITKNTTKQTNKKKNTKNEAENNTTPTPLYIPSLIQLCLQNIEKQLKEEKEGRLAEEFFALSERKQRKTMEELIMKKQFSIAAFSSFSQLLNCPLNNENLSLAVALDFSHSLISDDSLFAISFISSLKYLKLHCCRNISHKGLFFLNRSFTPSLSSPPLPFPLLSPSFPLSSISPSISFYL